MTEDPIPQIWSKWIKAAMLFFFIVALLGLSMRYFFIAEIPGVSYRNILHSHSHTALFGWGYMLLTGALFAIYGFDGRGVKVLRRLFYLNIICVAGMTVSFLIQGYGPVSIGFSTVQLISSYIFAYHYLRYLRGKEPSTARQFIRWAIFWQLISTLGLWAMGPVMTYLGKIHPLYSACVQFFLHFQLNGWFTFVVLGLLIHVLNKRGAKIEFRDSTWAMLQLSLVCTYFLSVTFSTPVPILFYINSVGVVLQLWVFIRMFREIRAQVPDLFSFKSLPDTLLTIGLGSMLFKVLIQSALVLPQMAVVSYMIHNFVIAFIHLIMLGSITFSMGGILLHQGLLSLDTLSKVGWKILLTGFLITEAVLFGQGLMLWTGFGFLSHYYELIFWVSVLLPLGVGTLIIGTFRAINENVIK